MQRRSTVLIALLLVFAFTATSFAASKQVTGEVSAVDANAGAFTVKGKNGDVTVLVDDKTQILSGKDKKTFADIKAGDRVTVKYTEGEGKNLANSIAIRAAVKEAEKEAAPAPAKKKAGGY